MKPTPIRQILVFTFIFLLSGLAVAQTNVALNKPAKQSSEYGNNGAPARLAVDGYTDGNFSVGSVTHTADPGTTDPWWEVDLGSVYEITRLNIHGRTDCCGERLSDFVVMLRNSESDSWVTIWKGGPLKKGRGRRAPQTSFAMASNLNDLPKARFVRIMLPGENRILSLAEVEVFGGEVGATALAKSCERTPNPDEVFIFVRGNYLGDCGQVKYKDDPTYPYSIARTYYFPERFDGIYVPFYSVKVGSNVVLTICDQKELKGNCKELRQDLPIFEGFPGGVKSFKLYTRTPKNYLSPIEPNESQVTVCQNRDGGGGCRKLNPGVYDFNNLTYNHIRVGSNAKAQAYRDRSQYGSYVVYTAGTRQATGPIKSIRVMSSSDQLISEVKTRPTPRPVATPAPTPKPSVIPDADDAATKRFILDNTGTKCLSIQGGAAKQFALVILEECKNVDTQRWQFTSDKRIKGAANLCLTNEGSRLTVTSCGPLGSQNSWVVSEANEIKSAWACMTTENMRNGSPRTVECNSSAAQKWRFRESVANTSSPVSGSTSTVSPKYPVVRPNSRNSLNLAGTNSGIASISTYYDTNNMSGTGGIRYGSQEAADAARRARSRIRATYYDFVVDGTGEVFAAEHSTKIDGVLSTANNFRRVGSSTRIKQIAGSIASGERSGEVWVFAIDTVGNLVRAAYNPNAENLSSLDFSPFLSGKFIDAHVSPREGELYALLGDSRITTYNFNARQPTTGGATGFKRIVKVQSYIYGLESDGSVSVLDSGGKTKLLDGVLDITGFGEDGQRLCYISSATGLLSNVSVDGDRMSSNELLDNTGTFVRFVSKSTCAAQNGNGETFLYRQ